MLAKLLQETDRFKNPVKAQILSSFFKTQKGGYGQGDIFLGIIVPIQRNIARKFKDLTLDEAEKLLTSNIHEHRLIAIFILICKYKKSDEAGKEKIIKIYLNNLKHVNNWDLVDCSAPNLLGQYLLDKDKDKDKGLLYKLAVSANLWERRVAILSTLAFIKERQFADVLAISKILLNDPHDLIQKAVGWMLREIGKRDLEAEKAFLQKHYKNMPRTMLRYAVERFDNVTREYFLN